MPVPTDPEPYNLVVHNLGMQIFSISALLASIATISMALTQLIKKSSCSRFLFHKAMMSEWLKSQHKLCSENMEYDKVKSEFIHLMAGKDKNTWFIYDQPGDDLISDLKEIVDVVLNFPESYPYLYRIFTRLPVKNSEKDSRLWEAYTCKKSKSALTEDELREAKLARTRLQILINHRIKLLKTSINRKWSMIWQVVSIILSSIILYHIFMQLDYPKDKNLLVLLSLFGGLLSPFAKDVMAALIKFKP